MIPEETAERNRQIDSFLNLEKPQFLELIGVHAMPWVASPLEIQQFITEDAPNGGSEALMGGGNGFRRKVFEKLVIFGNRFLENFSEGLKKAICQNKELHQQEKGNVDPHAFVGCVIGAITTHIPQLQEFSGLLLVIGAFIATIGIRSFCQMLPP